MIEYDNNQYLLFILEWNGEELIMNERSESRILLIVGGRIGCFNSLLNVFDIFRLNCYIHYGGSSLAFQVFMSVDLFFMYLCILVSI